MGGTYPSPTMAGSRTPVMIVATYAVFIHNGRDKYIKQAKRIYEAVKQVKDSLANVCNKHFISIIGDPQVRKNLNIGMQHCIYWGKCLTFI